MCGLLSASRCYYKHRVTNKSKKAEEGCKIWTEKGKKEGNQRNWDSSAFRRKRNHKLLSLQMRESGLQGAFPTSIPNPTHQAKGIHGFLVPSSGQRWSVFFLEWQPQSHALVGLLITSWILISPLASQAARRRMSFSLDDYTMRSNIF